MTMMMSQKLEMMVMKRQSSKTSKLASCWHTQADREGQIKVLSCGKM